MSRRSSSSRVGSSPPRADGPAKVVGEARYVDDLQVEGLWHGATVRSPHASARIVSIDPEPARELDPEAIVVTAADIDGPNVVQLIAEDWPVLASDEVQHVGEPVALVAAPSRDRARRAAEAVEVTWEERPAVHSIAEALAGDPRAGGDGPLVLATCGIDHGDVDAALEEADEVLEGTYESGYQEHIYIEPQGMIARWDGDRLEIVGSMQCPFYVSKALTHLFELDDESVAVRQSTTGGGFGGKEDYPDVIACHAALLARAAGRPVKIIYDRHEDIVGTTKRHPSRVTIRSANGPDGTLEALDIDVVLDGGAYTTLSPVVLSRGVIHAAGAYRCPNVRIRGRAIATNTATNGAFRGFGAPQTLFAIERHVDRMARRSGLDPLSFRRRNAYRVGDVTPTGQVLSESVSALECLETAVERTDFLERWEELEAVRDARPDDGRPLRGIGLSLYWHGSGFTGNGERLMKARAAVRLREGGTVEILAASTDIGQGTHTVFTQIVADAVGVGTDRVELAEHDTSVVPDSGPTVASRTVMIVGGLLERAGADLARTLVEEWAEAEGVDPDGLAFEEGRLVGPEGEERATFAEVAATRLAARGELRCEEVYRPTDDESFDEETYRGPAYPTYGWGCDVVEVEVDPDTLQVCPVKVTAVCDVGKAIHPVLCRGQVEGGTLQAVAWGYMEEIRIGEDGRYLNDRLQTYIIPTSADVPEIDAVLVENPAPVGPHGAKGVGELPMDGGAPALVAAVENATGIAPRRIPVTPEHLLEDRLAGRTVEAETETAAPAGKEVLS